MSATLFTFGPRRFAAAASAALVAVAVAACGSGGSAPTNGATTGLALSKCTVQSVAARCGSLSVPENPALPNGRHIHVRVVVVPAYGTHTASDPLFYFAGGPGGAASDSVQWAAKTFHVFNELHDLVFIDQRGTGGSNAMNCPALMNIAEGGYGTVPSAAAEASAARACLALTARSGDPTMYTTPLFTDDVDQVRAALGYASIDIYGGSYGVSSGLTYIQRHGEHVRAALFDSGSLLDVRLWQLSAASQQSALQTVLNRCAAEAACHATFPHVAAMLSDILARLTAAPVAVDVTNPRSGAVVHVTVNPVDFISVLSELLDAVQDQAQVPTFIFTANLGNWAHIVQQLMAIAPTSNPTDTLVAAQTIKCSDAWAQMDPAAIRATGGASLFTDFMVERAMAQQAFCAAWPAAAGAFGPVHSTAPIVFLNGTADPADPPGNVAGAAATMPNSVSVAVENYGHGVFSQDSSGCLANEATDFLAKGVPSKPADWLCAMNPPLPLFNVG